VITIGTPFADSPDHAHAHAHAQWIYRLLNGKKSPFTKALAR
jgi:hypothetical protein